MNTIFGFNHDPKYLSIQLGCLLANVKPGDRVGIEVTPNDLHAYTAIAATDFNHSKKMDLAAQAFAWNRDWYESEETATPEFMAGFWFPITAALQNQGATVVGIDTLDRLVGRQLGLRDLPLNEGRLLDYLMCCTHFEHHVARRIEEEKLNKVVVGYGHAPGLQRLTGWQVLPEEMRETEFNEFSTYLFSEYESRRQELPVLR